MTSRRLVPAIVFLALQAIQAQPSGPPLTQEQVLERWATALGGRDRLEHLRSVHLKGTVETGGMNGTFERWTTWRGESRMALDIAGAIRQITIFDGKQGWVLDANGVAHELAGGNLRSTVSSAYEASQSYLFAGRLPGHIVFSGHDAGASAYILRLEPDGGAPVTVYLDDTTFLPRKEESAGPLGNQRTITFEAWREFAGARIPVSIRQSTGDPKFDIIVTTRQVETDAPLAAGLFAKPAEAKAHFRFANGAHQVTIPVEVYAQHVFAPVRVNGGETAWFFVDSGAGTSLITKAWADKIGLASEGSMRAVGAAGATGLALAKNVLVSLPGLEVPLASVTVLDAAAALPLLGRQWEGVLGYDVLSQLVVRLDYERQQITLYDPAAFTPGPGAAALPVTFLGNWPLVSGRIFLPGRPPVDTKCFIDSGAGGLMLSTPFTKEHHVSEVVTRKVVSSIYGAGGESKRYAGRIAGIELGGFRLRGPLAGFSEDTREGALASPDIGAMVGGEILQRFTVTFDYPHHRILLEPNSHFADAFQGNQSGLSLVAEGPGFHRFLCDDVEPGSPAEMAGLRKGDVVTMLDGRPSDEFTLDQIDRLLAQSGRTLRLTILRDGRTFDVQLRLKDRI